MINIQDGAIKHIQKAVSAESHLPGSLHDEKKQKKKMWRFIFSLPCNRI